MRKSFQIKPCPFCGGCAEVKESGRWAWIACMDETCGGASGIKRSIDDAVRAWNRRGEAVDEE